MTKQLVFFFLILFSLDSFSQIDSSYVPNPNFFKLKAKNKLDKFNQKQGLWEFEVKTNAHLGSWDCLVDTNNFSLCPPKLENSNCYLTRAKGFYKDNKPIGIWIKYMPNFEFDTTFREYFIYNGGDCVKHIFFDHRNGAFQMDSLNPGRDTVINSFLPKLYMGKYYTFNFYSNGKKIQFDIRDKFMSSNLNFPSPIKLIKFWTDENSCDLFRSQLTDGNKTIYNYNIQYLDDTIVKTIIYAGFPEPKQFKIYYNLKGDLLKIETMNPITKKWHEEKIETEY